MTVRHISKHIMCPHSKMEASIQKLRVDGQAFALTVLFLFCGQKLGHWGKSKENHVNTLGATFFNQSS